MIIKDPRFKTPPWNVTIWRYMTFEKFLDIIINKQFFFSNAEKMTDKNEATIPKKNADRIKQKIKTSQPDDFKAYWEYYELENDFKSRKNSTFLNCWIMNRFESYALWKIYLGGSKSGVAIKTNIKNLTESINNVDQQTNNEIFIGKVNYTDYISYPPDIAKLITSKGLFYKYEEEVRLIILKEPEFSGLFEKTQNIIDGIRVKIDPKILIDNIYISPFTENSIRKVIRQTIEKIDSYYLDRIKISQINDS